MKEIYVRTKLVNGTYVYVPRGTEDTYGAVLIDNNTLKYFDDSNDKKKLKVNGAALVDNNTLKYYNDKLKVNSAALIDNYTLLYDVNTDELKVNVNVVSRLVNDEILDELDQKLNRSAVVQTEGDSAFSVMSQKAVTEKLNDKLDKGLIPSEYLPSYVDDVVEYDSKSVFPETGETGKIYVDKSTNLTYRWSGTTYIQVGGGDLALENGTGVGSLIQKTVSSSGTPYNNQASGSAAAAFGKNTKALGNADFVIGQSNEDNSSGSFVGGSNCTNAGDYSLVFGRYLNNTHLGAVRLGCYNKDNDYTAFSIGIGDLNTRKNGLEYDAGSDTLSIPTGNINYGNTLSGYNANIDGNVKLASSDNGNVKIGKYFIGGIQENPLLRVGSGTNKTNISGFETDSNGDSYFFGKLKAYKLPADDLDVIRRIDLVGETPLLSIKNGSGKGSLIQTNVKSSSGTPYNNIASGPASIAFGKNTKAQGNTDFVIGQNNTDNSSGSFVGGLNCSNTGDYSYLFGKYLLNTVEGAVRFGIGNKENDDTTFSIGAGTINPDPNYPNDPEKYIVVRKNGLEYDIRRDVLSLPTGDISLSKGNISVPTGNILYGTNLQGNNANFSGEVKIGKEFIGALGGKSVLRVGSYDKTPDVSGFEVDLAGDTTFLGKLKSVKTPTETTDVVRKLELDEVAVKVLTQEQVDSLF